MKIDHATRNAAGRRITLAQIPTTNSPQLLSTFWRGADAAVLGKPRQSPYGDITNRQGVTYSRAFINFWLRGYDAASAGGDRG
jgi:hypothetical protein